MEEKFFLEECPICRGPGMLLHEGGWNVQVECADCSAHTVYVEYGSEEEKKAAEEAKAAKQAEAEQAEEPKADAE